MLGREIPVLGSSMTDESSIVSRAIVVEEAREILLTLGGNPDQGEVFEANWRKLWQLVREADGRVTPEAGNRASLLPGEGREWRRQPRHRPAEFLRTVVREPRVLLPRQRNQLLEPPARPQTLQETVVTGKVHLVHPAPYADRVLKPV
jgi:hypothetical protein